MAPSCPVGAAARCASITASERTTACCSLCASPTARRRPLYEGAARGESTKQRASARDCPRATLWQPSQLRLQALNVSATPSEEIVAALATTMARRALEVVTTVGSFASLEQSSFASPREDPLRGPGARDRPSQAQKSFGLQPAQLQLSQTFLQLNLMQLQRSSAIDEIAAAFA